MACALKSKCVLGGGGRFFRCNIPGRLFNYSMAALSSRFPLIDAIGAANLPAWNAVYYAIMGTGLLGETYLLTFLGKICLLTFLGKTYLLTFKSSYNLIVIASITNAARGPGEGIKKGIEYGLNRAYIYAVFGELFYSKSFFSYRGGIFWFPLGGDEGDGLFF